MPWDNISVDWEILFGGNWLARIGILAVVIGVGFFLKLAFDNNWIGETGRVVLGVVGGFALLGASEYWRGRYPAYSQALAGGGLAILYLSIFAAFAIFELIGLYPAVAVLLVISIASASLAIRHESLALAIIGIFGAFVAPFITGAFAQDSTDVARAGPSAQLMVYVVIVDIGVLALSTFRTERQGVLGNWQWLTLLALIGSLLSFAFWYGQYSDQIDVLTAQLSITVIFLIFVAATTLFHFVWRRAPQAFDYALMVANAAAYFGISYGLLWGDFRPWMGGFTALLALFYGGIAYIAFLRGAEQRILRLMALGIALVFVTIAVPVQLGGPWVSVAWAAQGAVLLWLSFRLNMPSLRPFGAGVFFLFAAWLVIVDTPAALAADLTPFLNEYMPAYAIATGATYLAAYLFRRYRDGLTEYEGDLFPVFLTAANIFLTLTVPVQVGGVWIGVTWAAEALALMWLSYWLGIVELRMFSLGVFAALAARLFAFDTVDALTGDVRPFANLYLVSFLVSIAAAYLAAYLAWRNREGSEEWERPFVFPALLGLGTLFLTVGIPVQVDDGWVGLGWALEALALAWLSFRLGIYELRFLGVGVLGVLALRLLFVDTPVDLQDFSLILNHRMLGFVSGIAATYAIAYLMLRNQGRTWEWERAYLIPILLVGASLLTLWIASAELIAWVDSGLAGVTGRTADFTKSLGLSILWAAYASLALAIGIVKGWRMVRLGALALLAVPILKLFLVDAFALEQGYRVAAFLTLGALLLVGGFLYQRFSHAIRGFLFEERPNRPE